MNRKYLIPILAILTFIGGTVSIVLPFLPLGWFLYAVTILLLIPYFKPFQDGFKWLAKRDRTGFTHRASRFTADIYRWAQDPENAHRFEELSEEYPPKKGKDEEKFDKDVQKNGSNSTKSTV